MTYARKVRLTQILMMAALFALLETAGRLLGESNELLPPPSTVLYILPSLLRDVKIELAVLALVHQLVIAFISSIIFGALLGYAVAATARIERITLPVVLLIYSIPQITILPVFVLCFGMGAGSKIAFGISHGLFPIALGVISGVQKARANPIYLRWADSLGATGFQKLRVILLPQAVGSVCTGIRLSMATTLLGVLLADLYVSDNGVGYYIKLFTDTQQGPKLFGLVVLLAIAAILINSTVGRFERYATRWMT